MAPDLGWCAAVLALALLVTACPARTTTCAGASCAEQVVEVTVAAEGDPLIVQAEVADTPAERVQGLRFRRALPDGWGMLFLFDEVAPRTFTMEDTLIPLDLLVIRDRRVVQIIHMEPCQTTGESCRYPTEAADAALEVSAGTVSDAGVRLGAIVQAPDLPA